ncbi:MAG: hypothetical protein RIM84_15550 [Alphaproteobacteria bacterium]
MSLAIGQRLIVSCLGMLDISRYLLACTRVAFMIVGLSLLVSGGAQHVGAATGLAHDSVAVAQMADSLRPADQASAAVQIGHEHTAASGGERGHHRGDNDPAGGECCMAGCNVGALIVDEDVPQPMPLASVVIDGPEAVLLQLAHPIGKPPKL